MWRSVQSARNSLAKSKVKSDPVRLVRHGSAGMIAASRWFRSRRRTRRGHADKLNNVDPQGWLAECWPASTITTSTVLIQRTAKTSGRDQSRAAHTHFLYSCYNHFCAAGFQLNMIAFLKRHSSPFAF
jgi:hypothetical protein